MNIKNFTIKGFTCFYRSLMRFYYDFNSSEALELTYTLYTAVMDTYRHKNPWSDIVVLSQNEFYSRLDNVKWRAYRTEVQLYRAMEAILWSVDRAIINPTQLQAIMNLWHMLDNSELRFFKAFDMDINDERTIYNMCARSLTPRRDEPGLCLLKDWFDVADAK